MDLNFRNRLPHRRSEIPALNETEVPPEPEPVPEGQMTADAQSDHDDKEKKNN